MIYSENRYPLFGIMREMYGLIGRIKAVAGKRAELAKILVPGEGGMPG